MHTSLGPLLYVFLDTSDLAAKRETLEGALGFVPVEFEPHAPHEQHGVVKYDAGPVIVALNLGARPSVPLWHHGLELDVRSADPAALLSRAGDAGCRVDAGASRFADVDGHIFSVGDGLAADGEQGCGLAPLAELRLGVADVQRSLAFYREQLELSVLSESAECAVVSTGNLRLRLRKETAEQDRRGYLIVFHSPDLKQARAALADRGVPFRSDTQDTEIGLTCRFVDPDHHVFCLYQPSAESLSWGAGDKMTEIIEGSGQ